MGTDTNDADGDRGGGCSKVFVGLVLGVSVCVGASLCNHEPSTKEEIERAAHPVDALKTRQDIARQTQELRAARESALRGTALPDAIRMVRCEDGPLGAIAATSRDRMKQRCMTGDRVACQVAEGYERAWTDVSMWCASGEQSACDALRTCGVKLDVEAPVTTGTNGL